MSAKSAKQLSAAFLTASERCLTERPCGGETLSIVLVPGIVCAAFSVELGLKAQIMEDGRMAKGHRLFDLFQKLDPKCQSNLVKLVGLDQETFENELAHMSEAFVQWRYVYEHDEVSINLGFLEKLVRAMQALAK